ncbi:MAG: protein O-mannosyl-transferase family [Thermoleophilia bacterium]
MNKFMVKPRSVVGLVIGLASLVLYFITMAPDVLAHDSGEWQAAGSTFGISHSPGSPAYTLVSNLFALAPFGEPAARVTFISVLVGVVGVVAIYALVLLLFDRMLPALVAALTLALAGVWWGNSAVATPYNFVPAAMTVLLILLLLWSRSGDVRLVWGGALLTGFGLAYHPTMLFFLPVLVAGIFVLGPWRTLIKPRPLIVCVLLAAAGLGLYLYLPIRSAGDPAVAYGRIDSVSSFISYVSASNTRDVGGRVSSIPVVTELGDRLSQVVRDSYYPSYAILVFGPAIILFYPALWPLLRRYRRRMIFLALAMVAHMVLVFSLSDVYAQYYMPLLIYFSIWAGFSVFLIMSLADAYLGEMRLKYLPVVFTGVVYLIVICLGLSRTWDFANHHEDNGMRTYIDYVFSQARPDAVVLANWDAYTGLLYAQKVEGQRPDLMVLSVTQDDWRELLRQKRVQRPTAQVLLSLTLPFDTPGDLAELGWVYPLGIKGKTFQDFQHGSPEPAAERLYQLK